MKTKIMNSVKGVALAGAGIISAVLININFAYATISTRLAPVFALVESELLIIGRNLCVIALIGCGIKYAWANDAQSAKSAKDWAFKIFIGLIIMMIAKEVIPMFAEQVAGTTTPTV